MALYSSWNWIILLVKVSFLIRLFYEEEPNNFVGFKIQSCNVNALYSSVNVILEIDFSKLYIALIMWFLDSIKVLYI
jgi:hypothetical protein